MTTQERHSRRALTGIVTSAKTEKSITVEVQRTYKHAKYGKYVRKRKRYLAHDEQRTAREGDEVEICATRPISKRKRWRLVRVIAHSALGGIEATDAAAEIMQDITGKKPEETHP